MYQIELQDGSPVGHVHHRFDAAVREADELAVTSPYAGREVRVVDSRRTGEVLFMHLLLDKED